LKTAVLTEPFRVQLVDQTLPDVGPSQARIRIEQCGVCASEVDLWTGKTPERLPAAIGHEIAGRIEAIGPDVSTLKIGHRVAAWIHEGGFAEEAIVEERYCLPVTPGVEYAAVAEPLGCVINAVELAAPALADDVVIIGAGYMGSLLQMVTTLKGPRSVTVVDVRADALERAEALGATRIVNSATDSVSEAVNEMTDGRGADVTYEVTGINAGLELAGEVTRMGGKLCIVGYHQGEPRTIPLGKWNWMAFQLVNAHFRKIETIMTGMHAGMQLVNAGLLDATPLVTNVYPLARIAEALETATAKPDGFVKAVIEPSLA
jgi:L-iditol 2-dehydrogenase